MLLLNTPGRRADPRTARPPATVLQGPLPGEAVTGSGEVDGIWGMSATENSVRVDEGGPVVPVLYYALYLKIESNGTYELAYQAYWGSRDSSDPNMRAIDVREAGRASFANNRLRLEPQTTTAAERRPGSEITGAIDNEPREYRVALDGAYLNIAGRCAQYQVEPICRQLRDVWYSLRSGVSEWPIPPLQFPSR